MIGNKFETGPPRADSEPDQGVEKEKGFKGLESLYKVFPTEDGKFEVVLPGLYTEKGIVGVCTNAYDTAESAEQAAQKAQEDTARHFQGKAEFAGDQESLLRTYGHLYHIKQLFGGQYEVITPGLIDMETGYIVGTGHKICASWPEAKEYYLQCRESDEKLSAKPLLELRLNKEDVVSISDFDGFDPEVAPTDKVYDLPAAVEKHILSKDSTLGSHTYQKTIEEEDWETKLFSFITSYLEDRGSRVLEQLGIEEMDTLTPKQATGLANRIVLDLTKYKHSDAGKMEKNKSDKKTAVELLQEGLDNIDNRNEWEGNGVCRNFASMVKAVFEALKANQTKFSKLKNSYCTFSTGQEYRSKRQKEDVVSLRESGHAWNTFLTVTSKGADATISDVTWGKVDLETGEIKGIDYTFNRMEPIVKGLSREMTDLAPNQSKQLNQILSYYLLRFERPGWSGGHATVEEEKQCIAAQAIEFIGAHQGDLDVPPELVKIFNDEFERLGNEISQSELDVLWSLSKRHQGLSVQRFLENYLQKGALSVGAYQERAFIFNNDQLQRAVYEKIKENKYFTDLWENGWFFKKRMLQVMPELSEG